VKKYLRIIITSNLLLLISFFTLGQNNYYNWNDYVENVASPIVQYIETWRINILEKENEEDSVWIKNKEGSYSLSETYRPQKVDTFIKDNTIYTREQLPPFKRTFKFPDTVMIKKEIFNAQGLLIQTEGYFHGIDWPQYLYKSFKYDKSNRLIEQVELDNDSSHNYKFTNEYDDRNLIVRRNFLIEDELAQYSIWKYNKRGKLESILQYSGDDKLEKNWIYEHVKKKRLIIVKYFDERNLHKSSFHIRFDSNSNVLEDVYYSVPNTFEQGKYYSYDSNGNLINEKKIVSDDSILRVKEHFEYIYNDQNVLMHIEEIDLNGTRTIVEKYSYNNEGIKNNAILMDFTGKPVARLDYKYGRKE